MYNLIFYILEFGICIASIFSRKVRKMWRGERESFRILREKVDPEATYAWFHAASLGEFEQGRPIIEEFRKLYPECKILLTFFSPSGYEVRHNYEGADIVCYLPIDTPTNALRFLRTIRPSVAFFIKYEFWYNYLHILRHRGVPTYSVSSIFRPKQIFFRWYGKPYSRVLKCFTHFFVQNEESRQLLARLGIENVTVAGDTRLDRVLQIARQSKQISEVETFKDGKRVFVAGSTWQPDEEIFLPYFAQHKDWKIIIAPHVIDETHLAQIMQLLEGRKAVRLTKIRQEAATSAGRAQAEQQLREAEALIIDCFGLLSSIYKYGDIAYVGGGFGAGIHNLPEAAVWNLPVIFGPENEKFQEAQDLKACGGGKEITSAEDFKAVMDDFITSPHHLRKASDAAGQYIRSRSGATAKLLHMLREHHKKTVIPPPICW